MPIIYGIDLPGLVTSIAGAGAPSMTLITVAQGAQNADPTTGASKTNTSYVGRGFVEDYLATEREGTVIEKNDRRATLLANTFGSAVPKPNDQIVAEGSTYRIVRVERDASAAVYICQVRG